MGIRVGKENPVSTDLEEVKELQKARRIANQERKDEARRAADEEAATKASVKAKREAARAAAKAARTAKKSTVVNETEEGDGQ